MKFFNSSFVKKSNFDFASLRSLVYSLTSLFNSLLFGNGEEIDKLKSVALHLQISSLYQHFEHLERSLEFDTKEEIRHVVSNLHKTIEQFKEAIS